MKVKIDADLCTGCEDCTDNCPSMFRLTNDWIAEVIHETVPEGMEDEIRNVADECQFEAIIVED